MRLRVPLYILLLALCAACGAATAVANPAPVVTVAASTPVPSATPTLKISTALPQPTPTPVFLPSPTFIPEVQLLFTGDINPGRCVYAYSKQAGDLGLPYRPLADLLQGADITIGSLDAALSDYNPAPPCMETRNLLAPAEAVEGLKFAGFDVLTVATNHIKDCGLVRGCINEAMLDTLDNLRAAGIQSTGAGRNLAEAATPAMVNVQGVRFAFLGFSAIDHSLWATDTAPGTAPLTPPVYLDAIRRAKEQADVVIALPHWGTEYSSHINWEQINGARAMVEAGAALVVGNHPHHVQGVETFPNGAVAAYALGNFVFDQEWSDGRQFPIQGILLKAVFRGAQLQRIELIPIHIYDNFQPRLAPPAEAKEILAQVEASLAETPRR